MYSIAGLFIVCLLFCVISVLYSSFENLTSQNIGEKLKEYEKQGSTETETEIDFKRWKNIDAEYKDFKRDYLMTMDEYSQFRNDLEGFFVKYQVRSLPVTFRYKNTKEYMQVEMLFSLTGMYPNIKQFINEILNQKKIIIIRSVELSKDKRSDMVSGDFILEVYIVR